jgi:hypothetical protein
MEKPNSGWFNWYRSVFGKLTTAPKPETPQIIQPKTPPARPKGKIGTNLDYNNRTMLSQLNEAQKYRSIIEEASRRYDVEPAIICGIGSRESHWGLALKPPTPAGTGDFAKRKPRGDRKTALPPDGGGYGRGLVQIDYDWHEFARTGNWRSPKENIFYGCQVMDQARTFFNKRTNLSQSTLLRAILAAYNGGATATLKAIQNGLDVDAYTTGGDYSRDVLNRAGWFELHGW